MQPQRRMGYDARLGSGAQNTGNLVVSVYVSLLTLFVLSRVAKQAVSHQSQPFLHFRHQNLF